MAINLSFFDKPSEVIEFTKKKHPEIHFDYDEIMHHAHDTAFTVAKITKLDLLNDIQKSLIEAMEKGLKFEEWKENIMPNLAKKGWLGEVNVTEPKTGEIKRIYVGNRRLKTIYDTNMRTAFAKAEYESISSSHAKYIRYIATLDSRTRPSHALLHNLVLPKDDPFWDTNYPPNAWNCRCQVRAVFDDKELKRRGLRVGKRPKVNVAHKDWAFHVGKVDTQKRLMDVYKNKANKIKDERLKDQAHKSGLKILANLSSRVALFKAIKQMFKTPLKDAKTSKKRISIAKATDEIKKAFNDDKLDQIYLSEWTIASHKDKANHLNMSVYDYYIMFDVLKRKAKSIRGGSKDNHIVAIYEYRNKKYKVVLKKTNVLEIYIQSISKGSDVK